MHGVVGDESSSRLLRHLWAGLAGRHPYGCRSSDDRALFVVLVFEGPFSLIYKRLSPFFAYLELHSSRNLDQTVVCGLRGKPVDSPKNRRAAARRAPLTKTVV